MVSPMNDLHIAKKAQDDLDEIRKNITEELGNPSAATSTVKKITAAIRILRDYALVGAALSSVTNVQSDYRFLGAGNYLIFYRVHGKDVFVDRILYGRRDYLRILFGDTADDE